ncbi:MarR family EPS-associated transcriptional regulator [Methylophilaceae bacterium]|nr:MarR family EPS-associated transcriptional regulator [Methylophilaceae bacterium]
MFKIEHKVFNIIKFELTIKLNTQSKIEHPDIQFKVMDLIQKKPHITQRELGRKAGISLGSIHYCLKMLAEKGLVKVKNFNESPNKSNYLYLLTPKGICHKSNLAITFLKRKKYEYKKLKKEIEEISNQLNR